VPSASSPSPSKDRQPAPGSFDANTMPAVVVPRIAVVQLTTIFYQLQNSECISQMLASDIQNTLKLEQP